MALLRVFLNVARCICFFFFNDTATTEIYTLSLHDALPISRGGDDWAADGAREDSGVTASGRSRSEEHTSELQSLAYLVCRLLLEKKKTQTSSMANPFERLFLPHYSRQLRSWSGPAELSNLH